MLARLLLNAALIILLLHSACCFAAPSLEDLLRAHQCSALLEPFQNERTLSDLTAFENARLFNHTNLTDLPVIENLTQTSTPVFRVSLNSRDKRGGAVLRHRGPYANPQFESFASRFVRRADVIISPLVRYIPGSPEWEESSLALFYPGKDGRDYWEELTGIELRRALIMNLKALRICTDFSFANNITQYSVEYPAKTRRNVTRDFMQAFKKHFPSLSWVILPHEDRFFEQDELYKIHRYLYESSRTKQYNLAIEKLSKDLIEDAWRQIPQNLRTQLADRWALAMVLGIKDIHEGNLLFLNHRSAAQKIIWIDLAYESQVFIEGAQDIDSEMETANATNAMSLDTLWPRLMANDLSPKLKFFLESLTPALIAEDASPTSRHDQVFPITQNQIHGILERAKLILAMIGSGAGVR